MGAQVSSDLASSFDLHYLFENMAGERTLSQSPRVARFHFYELSRTAKSTDTESRLVVARG